MTTDWWNVSPKEGATQTMREADPPAPSPPGVPVLDEPEREEEEDSGLAKSRGRAAKVVGGVAGAVIAGTLILGAVSGGGDGGAKPTVSVPTENSIDLPAAGGGVPEGNLPAAGGGPTQSERSEPQARQQAPVDRVVLTAHPSGRGRVGVIMQVTIRNDTDEPLTVLSSLMKGDGRSAIVGEGTLAPGSRIIQPGEVAEGTVEFTSNRAPHQVALLNLSGNLIAASN